MKTPRRFSSIVLLLILLAGYGQRPPAMMAPGTAGTVQSTTCSASVSPPALTRYPMSYDTNRGRVVLYAGLATWEYDGTAWQPVTTTHVPWVDTGAVMAYDQLRGLTVLSGLRNNFYEETWEYDGLDWTPITPTAPYPLRVYGAMVADSGRGRLVFFGGMACAKPACAYFDETYEYTGTTWAPVPTLHAPAPRASLGMAYDSARGVTVLFGGGNSVSGVFSDTWEYDGTDWQPVTPTVSPPARADHAMVYDAGRGVVVLFGGMAEARAFGDTWEYDGVTWRQVMPPLSPTPRNYQAMAYDTARQVVVLYGGDSPAGGAFGDTWEYDGVTWKVIASCSVYLPRLYKNR